MAQSEEFVTCASNFPAGSTRQRLVGQRLVDSIRFLCATDASTGEQSVKEEEKIAAREIQLEKATTRRNSISEIAAAANRDFNRRCASEDRQRERHTHTHGNALGFCLFTWPSSLAARSKTTEKESLGLVTERPNARIRGRDCDAKPNFSRSVKKFRYVCCIRTGMDLSSCAARRQG